MGDEADLGRAGGEAEDAGGFELGDEFGGGAEAGLDAEDDDVGIDAVGLKREAVGGADRLGEDLGVGVVVLEAVTVVLQSVESAGGDDAVLPHGTAEELAVAAGFFDHVLRASQGGADRGTEAFAEADANRVEVFAPFGFRNASGGGRVPEASAVEVGLQAGVVSPLADGGDVFDRLDFASAAVVCVFEADEGRANEMVVFGADQAAKLIDVEDAVLAFDGAGGDAAELREGTLLVVVNVTAGFADEFVAGLAVNADADLVGHRAGGHEDGRFFAEDFGGEFLKAVAGGIDVDHVVADFGGGDELPHGGRGAGDGVGAKVDGGDHGWVGEWRVASIARLEAKLKLDSNAWRVGRQSAERVGVTLTFLRQWQKTVSGVHPAINELWSVPSHIFLKNTSACFTSSIGDRLSWRATVR